MGRREGERREIKKTGMEVRGAEGSESREKRGRWSGRRAVVGEGREREVGKGKDGAVAQREGGNGGHDERRKVEVKNSAKDRSGRGAEGRRGEGRGDMREWRNDERRPVEGKMVTRKNHTQRKKLTHY